MKAKTDKPNKSNESMNLTLEVKQEISFPSVLGQAVDKFGAKKVVRLLLSRTLWDTLEKSHFPMSLLATQEDEDKADACAALYYLKENWDDCSNKGMKLLEKKFKEVEAHENR